MNKHSNPTHAEVVALLERVGYVVAQVTGGAILADDIFTAATALRSGEVVLCPKEPTEDMLQEGRKYFCFHDHEQTVNDCRLCYRAMLDCCAKGKP